MTKLAKIIRPKGEGKTVIKNVSYLAVLQIAGYVFPIITVPYLARTIGAEGYGRIAFAAAIMVWIQTITDWGFNYTATRDVAQNRDNKEVVSRIFSNVLWSRMVLCLVSGIVLCVMVVSIPTFRENWKVIFVTFLLVPGHICFPDWFFQAVEKMKYTTIFNLCIKLFFTLAVFLVIKERGDFIYQPLLTSIGYLACGAVALYMIIRRWGYRIYPPEMKSILGTIKSGTDVFINNLMPNLYNSLSIVLLGFWGGPVANGIYDGARKFVEIFKNLHNVLARAFFPFLSRRTEKHHIFAVINIGTAAFGAILLALLAPLIIRIFLGEEFAESVLPMRLLAVSIVFLAMANTYGTNYLIIHHQERILRNYTIAASVIGLLAAIPLIKCYSYLGVAWVVLLCRALLGLSSYYLTVRHKKSLRNKDIEE